MSGARRRFIFPHVSFAVKATALVWVIALLSISFVASVTYLRAEQQLVDNLGSQLKRIVQTTAPLLDASEHENIFYQDEVGLEGERSFSRIQEQLIRVRDSNDMPHHNGLSPLYTLRKSWQFEKNHQLEFVVMTDPDEAGHYFTGAKYPVEPFQLKVFNGKVMVTDIYQDGEGTWLTAAAPIYDAAGEVVAILQADRRVDFIFDQIRHLRELYIRPAIGSLVLGLLLALLFSWRTMQPIKRLAQAASDFGSGNYDERIDDERNDEFGVVFRSFNDMADNIRRSEMELIFAHTESERAHKEVVDILESISDAFFAVDKRGRFSYVNNQAEKLLQQPRQELIGRIIWGQIPFMVTGFDDALVRAMNEKMSSSVEGYYEPLDIWIEAHVYPGEDGISVYFRDISERKQAEEKLYYLSSYDELTGLPNRTLFMEQLNHTLKRAESHGRMVGVMYCNLDRFRVVNDSLGHNIGDQLLKIMARRFVRVSGDAATVARFSGDEFVILLPDMPTPDDINTIAEKIIEALSTPVMLEGNEVVVPASVGISVYPDHGQDLNTLLKNADTAMHHAKSEGKNKYRIYSLVMDTAPSAGRLTLESALRRAIDNHELRVFYQPQVDHRTRVIVGAEALVRWQHTKLGLVSPAVFLPLAEETGLIEDIGNWVMHQACWQTRVWHDAGYAGLRIAVNLSDREFNRANLVDFVGRHLQATQLPPDCLELELTENIITRNTEQSISVMRKLQEMGVKLSIDDFGTGNTSLSHLKQFPVHLVKIDRSFVTDIANNAADATITEAIISLSHNLDMKVVAEGVENIEQWRILCAQQCDYIQGYLFSKPVPVDEFSDLLKNQARHFAKIVQPSDNVIKDNRFQRR